MVLRGKEGRIEVLCFGIDLRLVIESVPLIIPQIVDFVPSSIKSGGVEEFSIRVTFNNL